MSKREVEVLLEGHRGQTAGRTRSARGRNMATSPDCNQQEQLKAELAAALADRDKKARQVAELTAEVEATQAELARVTSVSGEQIDGLAKELDNEWVKSELAKLRAIEELHQQHQSALEQEREYGNEDRKWMEAWVGDLKESFKTERDHLLTRITELEKEKLRWSHHEGELSGQITPLPHHTYMEVSGIGPGISEHESPRTEMVPGAGVVGALGLGETEAELLLLLVAPCQAQLQVVMSTLWLGQPC